MFSRLSLLQRPENTQSLRALLGAERDRSGVIYHPMIGEWALATVHNIPSPVFSGGSALKFKHLKPETDLKRFGLSIDTLGFNLREDLFECTSAALATLESKTLSLTENSNILQSSAAAADTIKRIHHLCEGDFVRDHRNTLTDSIVQEFQKLHPQTTVKELWELLPPNIQQEISLRFEPITGSGEFRLMRINAQLPTFNEAEVRHLWHQEEPRDLLFNNGNTGNTFLAAAILAVAKGPVKGNPTLTKDQLDAATRHRRVHVFFNFAAASGRLAEAVALMPNQAAAAQIIRQKIHETVPQALVISAQNHRLQDLTALTTPDEILENPLIWEPLLNNRLLSPWSTHIKPAHLLAQNGALCWALLAKGQLDVIPANSWTAEVAALPLDQGRVSWLGLELAQKAQRLPNGLSSKLALKHPRDRKLTDATLTPEHAINLSRKVIPIEAPEIGLDLPTAKFIARLGASIQPAEMALWLANILSQNRTKAPTRMPGV